MHSATPDRSNILPSNLGEDTAIREEPFSTSEPFANLVLLVGALALLVTGLTVIGFHFGGPIPSLAFWGTFGPMLLLPLAILLGISLAPGGLLRDQPASATRRIHLAIVGLAVFALALGVLNVPSVLLLSR
jgi:hypothetical protein